ncbi:MAG: hypothetical protein WCT45_01970 [Candidatus Paceibacterota bacterium]|jgi:phenylacetate-CoA ligase
MKSLTSGLRTLEIPPTLRNIERLEKSLRSDEARLWEKRGEKQALALFHAMAERVPAYKDVLKKNRINPDSVSSIQDFTKLPLIDKQNYLRAYPLADLCWDGEFSERAWTVCTTSGSTGEPFYFPHGVGQDAQYALLAELYLRANFQIHKKRTLYINGFPMGAWIGGVFTYKAVTMLAERGTYPLSIINPGINKIEIIKAVKKLGGDFDQIIIGSYGPFLKDTLDDGIHEGVDWKKYNLGFIFSAEGFSEGFRDYVLETAGKKDDLAATLNHYGTVDLGTMSYETPLAILARREALAHPDLYQKLFDDSIRVPTLTQYLPNLFYFEEVAGTLACSAAAGLPLVRYDLKDVGGVYRYDEMLDAYRATGIDLEKDLATKGLAHTGWKLPFVYVYERNDFSVSFHAFQIYPATIRRAFEHSSLDAKITGKFAMRVEYDQDQNQQFEINLELKKDVPPTDALKEEITRLVTDQLLKESSEYRETYRMKGQRVLPHIVFWQYEHERFFRPGIKQKWVLR